MREASKKKKALSEGQFPSVVSFSNLKNRIGFQMRGEGRGSSSGRWVSTAGDFNGDGIDDFLIGAPDYSNTNKIYSGRVYLVFGSSSITSNSLLELSSLNGVTGFKVEGEWSINYAGFSVSPAGDINDDGKADLLIGAYGYSLYPSLNAGCSYVIFGGSVVSGGTLSLANADLKLTGNTVDFSGISVSGGLKGTGDVNGDGIDDIVIGALGTPSYQSCTSLNNRNPGGAYVVLGDSNRTVSELKLANSFKLTGETKDSCTGYSVSLLGDINGDDFTDIGIGAHGYNRSTGRVYIKFGGPDITTTGGLLLGSLNGTLGFILEGEKPGDKAGLSVSGAGDVNGDGIGDFMIGAPGAGRSYVMFGSSQWNKRGLVNLSEFKGAKSYGFKIEGEPGSQSGYAVSRAGDFNQDGIDDLLIAASPSNPSAYLVFGRRDLGEMGALLLSKLSGKDGFKITGLSITTGLGGVAVGLAGDINGDGVSDLLVGAQGYDRSTGESGLIYGDTPPNLVSNSLVAIPGKTVTVTPPVLSATDENEDESALVFTVSNVRHGQFIWKDTGLPARNFSQKNITDGQILFQHDGSDLAPTYDVAVNSSGLGFVLPFSSKTVLLTLNQLTINQGQTVPFNSETLNITSADSLEDIRWLVDPTSLQGGGFVGPLNITKTEFTQQEVMKGQIAFMADGSTTRPAFTLQLSTAGQPGASFRGDVDFAMHPVLLEAYFNVQQQTEKILLKKYNFKTNDSYTPASELIYTVEALYGYFSRGGSIPVYSFTQQQVNNEEVYFTVNSTQWPSFNVSVSNGRLNCLGCPRLGEVLPPLGPTPTPSLGPVESTPTDLNAMALKVFTPSAGAAFTVMIALIKYFSGAVRKKYFSRSNHGGAAHEITDAVLSKLWIGCCLTRTRYIEYCGAVGSIVNPEHNHRPDEETLGERWKQAGPDGRSDIEKAVAEAVEEELTGHVNYLWRFFKGVLSCTPEAKPSEIKGKRRDIIDKALYKIGLFQTQRLQSRTPTPDVEMAETKGNNNVYISLSGYDS